MRCSSFGLTAAFALVLSWPATAAVEWTHWQDSSFQEAVDQAAREKKLVALVVTQPDWCPPCIRLNANWLNNPDDESVSPLLADAVMLEVLGYDAPGAALLKAQGIRFQGTPSLLVYRPSVPGAVLGRAQLLGSVVGAPKDYAERLRVIVEGHDPVAAVRARLRTERNPLERAMFALELADLLVSRGDANGAAKALRLVRDARRTARALTPEQAEDLDLLVRDAEWKRAASVEMRVNKDYETALAGIDAWLGRHGREARDAQDIAYARGWTLAKLGRTEEAREEMTAGFLQEGQEGLETYAYFAFRVGDAAILSHAEGLVRHALEHGLGEEGNLAGALGRLLRQQGRYAEAVDAFTHAVELTQGDTQVVWQGQLDYCRGELAASGQG
jgi:tetratricopeptide (TPR) repeat protein